MKRILKKWDYHELDTGSLPMKNEVAAHQSQFLPWAPYFKKVAQADTFVWMDNVQFQRNGRQNRTQIWSSQGEMWLTVPVNKGHLKDTIHEKRIVSNNWNIKAWKSIEGIYSKAPYWNDYHDALRSLFFEDHETLDNLNWALFQFIINTLGINTKIVRLSELKVAGHKTDLVVNLCKACKTTTYISGMGAKEYLQEEPFLLSGISLSYLPTTVPDYQHFKTDFIKGLSILDMLFNVPKATVKDYLHGY